MGFEEGRAETNLENARKMKSFGIDDSIIAQVTKLTLEEISRL